MIEASTTVQDLQGSSNTIPSGQSTPLTVVRAEFLFHTLSDHDDFNLRLAPTSGFSFSQRAITSLYSREGISVLLSPRGSETQDGQTRGRDHEDDSGHEKSYHWRPRLCVSLITSICMMPADPSTIASDPEEPYLQPSNRGNKLKRKANHMQDGQYGRTWGPKIFKAVYHP